LAKDQQGWCDSTKFQLFDIVYKVSIVILLICFRRNSRECFWRREQNFEAVIEGTSRKSYERTAEA